jgi:hypothetical protein
MLINRNSRTREKGDIKQLKTFNKTVTVPFVFTEIHFIIHLIPKHSANIYIERCIEIKQFCLVWFYSEPTQVRLYSAETGMMISVKLWCYKLKTTLALKSPHLLELRDT